MVLAVALGHDVAEIRPARIVESELTVAGSIGFDAELPDAVAVLAADPGRWRPLITEAVLLEEAAGRLRPPPPAPAGRKVGDRTRGREVPRRDLSPTGCRSSRP